MIIRNLRRKIFFGVSVLAGTGLGAYYFHSRFIYDPNREIIKTLQENSTIIALSNNQIANYSGPSLTSLIPDENIPLIGENAERFSFNLDLRKGKSEENQDEFAELLVNCVRLEEMYQWAISSIDIRFKHSNSKWFKLFETFQLTEQNCDIKSEEIEHILNSNLHKDSEELLKTLAKNENFIFKVIDLMFKDKQKLSNLGPPLVFLSLLIQKNNPELKLGQLKIEGKKATAELMFYIEKKPDTKLKAVALMYQLFDDFILNDSELAIKYQNDAIRSCENNEDLINILSSINLSKIIEDKILKNHRSLNSIGKPIEFKCVLIDKDKKENSIKVKLVAVGRLNNAELVLTLEKDNLLESWKISNCDFKILWRTLAE